MYTKINQAGKTLFMFLTENRISFLLCLPSAHRETLDTIIISGIRLFLFWPLIDH